MLDWTNGEGTAWYWLVQMMIDVLGGARTTKVAVRTLVDGQEASEVIRPVQTRVCACGMAPRHDVDARVGAVYARGFSVAGAEDGRRVVLLLNTRNQTRLARVMPGQGAGEGQHALLFTVDFEHGVRTQSYSNTSLLPAPDGRFNVSLGGFAVALLALPS